MWPCLLEGTPCIRVLCTLWTCLLCLEGFELSLQPCSDCIVYRQSPLGRVDPSFRALSGRLKFTVRRHTFNKDYLSTAGVRLEELQRENTAALRVSLPGRLPCQDEKGAL